MDSSTAVALSEAVSSLHSGISDVHSASHSSLAVLSGATESRVLSLEALLASHDASLEDSLRTTADQLRAADQLLNTSLAAQSNSTAQLSTLLSNLASTQVSMEDRVALVKAAQDQALDSLADCLFAGGRWVPDSAIASAAG
jgi:uncharacterized protein involved in exopolysaccharide biosynthesis